MTRITLDLSPELYERLTAEAARLGKSSQHVAQEWLAERLTPAAPSPTPTGDRAQAIKALRDAGLLTELSAEEQVRASQSSATLNEVRAAMDRAGGKPLSELILEMRGPKG
jgi:hypothetical protein